MSEKRGRPKTDTEQITVRLPRALLDAVDGLRRLEADPPTRPEAVRRILTHWLSEHEAGGLPRDEAQGPMEDGK